MTPDDTPPYLTIDAPGADVIVREASVDVSGESEPGAVLTVAGKPLATDAAGHFATTIEAASRATTRSSSSATDPAGNKTTRERQVRLHARRAVGGRLRSGASGGSRRAIS